ncbi:hypothetical protein DICPUDRAFT_156047 [Dictyostelium purpureum]|uniref:T4 RNA ligase 1-like N-terminal domain-containing protein n=1 Tax=Dictyostelium purpureum TaxID=5786 RepID=F0ZVK0_DICPU|nr:uncharacterized protein DICPUDRAFT_156047 [Dictyostelium purpureum]EGC32031.1 hypothetical protein DICPUDRAFT_156047 [Dictyostelium purpureum]|eukprot:XP_003291449.1 hypothetical protein DICPUDRAFT_156047 [Dictyostelium purpureum]
MTEYIDRNQSYEKRNSTMFAHDITIEDCREAIKGVAGFRETLKNGLVCFNYDFCFRDSFPNPDKESDSKKAFLHKVRRECRGIIFEEKTGKIVCRKLHKFFNINELPETNQDDILLDEEFILLEKLDGSLIAPINIDGSPAWGSKAGITDLTTRIEGHIKKKLEEETKYDEFAKYCFEKGYTPLFEWCSVLNQIVLFYPVDKLHLIAMRNMLTGDYLTHSKMVEAAKPFNVPVVECVDIKNHPQFVELYKELSSNGADHDNLVKTGAKRILELVQKIPQVEGYILKFDSGRTYKLKTNWYFEFHGIATNNYSHEKDVFHLILNDGLGAIDDLISKLAATGQVPERFFRIQNFAKEVLSRVEELSYKVIEFIIKAKSEGKMRKNISNDNSISNNFKKMVFSFYDTIEYNHDPKAHIGKVSKSIQEKLKLLCFNSNKLDEVKKILGGNLDFKD